MPSKIKKTAKGTSAKSSAKAKKVAAAKKPVKKAVAKKAVAKKVAVKKSVAKKAPSKAIKKVATAKTVGKKAAVKKVTAKKTAVKKIATKKTAVKKPVAKKVVAKKTVAKKVAAKKPAVKKAVKKPVAKKTVAKKTVKKTPAKVVKKAVAKKATTKATSKKTPVKKAVAVKTVKKAIKKPVAKSTSKAVVNAVDTRNAKKPLAPAKGSKVKASSARYHITPIKAPVMVPQPKLKPIANKTEMTLPIVPPDYEPTDSEEFMNPVMREYFRQRLIAWRDELLRESEETLTVLSEEGNMQKPDIADRASEETDLAIEFRVRDRERKLINKINEALQRIEDNSYGYCDETGDPIPVKRLIAYPTVSMTVEAREIHERRERTQRDTYE